MNNFLIETETKNNYFPVFEQYYKRYETRKNPRSTKYC